LRIDAAKGLRLVRILIAKILVSDGHHIKGDYRPRCALS
jgi:hypothetical protein